MPDGRAAAAAGHAAAAGDGGERLLLDGSAEGVQAAFAAFDVDRSGALDAAELRVALRRLGLQADATEVRAVLEQYAERGGGARGGGGGGGAAGGLGRDGFGRLVRDLQAFHARHLRTDTAEQRASLQLQELLGGAAPRLGSGKGRRGGGGGAWGGPPGGAALSRTGGSKNLLGAMAVVGASPTAAKGGAPTAGARAAEFLLETGWQWRVQARSPPDLPPISPRSPAALPPLSRRSPSPRSARSPPDLPAGVGAALARRAAGVADGAAAGPALPRGRARAARDARAGRGGGADGGRAHAHRLRQRRGAPLLAPVDAQDRARARLLRKRGAGAAGAGAGAGAEGAGARVGAAPGGAIRRGTGRHAREVRCVVGVAGGSVVVEGGRLGACRH